MNDFEVNKTMSQIFRKLRLDHTLSQSTDKLRSDNSLFQIVLIERGFVMQSIILLNIKETDGRPADGVIQSRIGWEEIEDAHGTSYSLRAECNWKKTKYADAGRQNLVLNVWNEQRPWLLYISPQVFTPKDDQEGWTNGWFPHTKLKLCHKVKVKVKVSFIVNSATCTVHTYRELKLRYSLTPWCIQITLNTNSRMQKYR